MDACTGKRRAGGLAKRKEGYNVGFKGTTTSRDQNIQLCSRIGCCGRIKYSQNTKFGVSDVSKCSKPSLRSSNRNETYDNSARGNSVMTSAKKSKSDSTRKVSTQLKSYSPESSLSGDSEAVQPKPLPSTSLTGKLNASETGSSSMSSSIRPRKTSHIKLSLHKPNALTASSVTSVSKSPSQGPSGTGSGGTYGLRSLRCNSIRGAVSSNCSSSSSSKTVRKNVMNKKIPERVSMASSRNTTSPSSTDGSVSPSTSGISISDSRNISHASREVTNGATSLRTSRSVNVNNRTRFSSRVNLGNSSSARRSAFGGSQFPQSGMSFHVGSSSSSQHFSANDFSGGSSSYSLSTSNDDYQSTLMPLNSDELGFAHFRSYEAMQRFNINGVAELLLALERVEQDEEQLTHEQILALETSFLFGSLVLDQHRDMRLDIDNMSYEELLALGDRMGSVSTAVSEDALEKCVRRSTYQMTSTEVLLTGFDEDGDDIKCCICQEEFALRDEVGELVECEHCYHVTCIYQWLRLKNWCPICKVAASPSESFSSC